MTTSGVVLPLLASCRGSSCVSTIWRNGAITHLDALDTTTDICPCDGETVVGAATVDGVWHAAVAIHDS